MVSGNGSGGLDGFETLKVGIDGALVTVRLNRPDRRNALSRTMMAELTRVAVHLKQCTDLHAVVLTGASTFFSAGADLSERTDPEAAPATLLDRRQAVLAGPDLCAAWEALEQITIVAIEGYCIGGAAALAVSCDFRIMGRSATLRLPEVPLGINMSWHALPRLVALAGPARAKRFTIFGDALNAEDAVTWGLADACVPDGQAEEEAVRWAWKVTRLPPVPVRMSKEAINAASAALARATIFMDRDQFLLTSQSGDFAEGTAAFFERRDPEFTGN
ncbi:MAG: enoyl-CoA hydratase/isomerase family protein [Alphaproteobacteria bacterium]